MLSHHLKRMFVRYQGSGADLINYIQFHFFRKTVNNGKLLI